MNKILEIVNMLKIKRAGLTLMLLFAVLITSFGQIGGNATPLYSSTHRYQIQMSNAGNSFAWSIYAGEVTTTQIDNRTVTPLNPAYYKVGEVDVDVEGNAYIFITFSGPTTTMPYEVAPGSGKYTLVYNESITGRYSCEKSVVFYFTLKPPIDIDINLHAGFSCADSTGVPQHTAESMTTRLYDVEMVYPLAAVGYVGKWYISISIEVKGAGGGAAATIYSVAVAGVTLASAINSTTHSFDYQVNEGVSSVQVAVTYNDKLGVDQNITLELYNISADYSERDKDEIESTIGNIVQDKILNLPDSGNIVVLN